MSNLILNPNEQVVKLIKADIKANNGYCICIEQHNKTTKCPKACKKSGVCKCGLYVPQDYEPEEYDLD